MHVSKHCILISRFLASVVPLRIEEGTFLFFTVSNATLARVFSRVLL